jgi:hypothetical protein
LDVTFMKNAGTGIRGVAVILISVL